MNETSSRNPNVRRGSNAAAAAYVARYAGMKKQRSTLQSHRREAAM